jgi:hypothetical protein
MQQQEEQLREELVACIKACKMVQLEELSAEFGIRTKEIIDHIHALESSGQLTGVMDDRGKVRSPGLWFVSVSRIAFLLCCLCTSGNTSGTTTRVMCVRTGRCAVGPVSEVRPLVRLDLLRLEF